MLINDDDLDAKTRDAGFKVNGHLMHQFKDQNGDLRWQFYTQQSDRQNTKSLKELTLGKKRSSKEAGFTDIPVRLEDTSVLMKHVRDYAFTEQKGGAKGEAADYILQEGVDENGQIQMRYVPVVSKIKLNKKRKATTQQVKGVDKVENIIICPRALQLDEAKDLKSQLEQHGTQNYKVDGSIVAYDDNNAVKKLESNIHELMMGIFESELKPADLLSANDKSISDDGIFDAEYSNDEGQKNHRLKKNNKADIQSDAES